MKIQVHDARPQDADDLRIINDQMDLSLRKVYRPTQAGYANRSRISKDLTRIVAVSNGKVVGTAQHYVGDGVLRLLGLAVHEEYRRRGIARALVNRLLDLAEEKGLLAVRISTIKETSNVPIFEKLGFEVVAENHDKLFEGIHGEAVTDVEMEKRRN